MKKYLLSIILMLCCGTMMAQQNEEKKSKPQTEQQNEFEPQWFVSVGVGAQKYFGDHNKQLKAGERLSPALDIAVGRWFTPVIGARLMYSGLSAKGATMSGAHSTGDKAGIKDNADSGAQYLQNQKFNYMNLHADVLVNVTNLILGYNNNRIVNVSPLVGLGVATASKPSNTSLSLNVGLLTSFKVTDAVDINLDIHGALVGDSFDGEKGERRGEGPLSVVIGAAYKF